MYAAKTIHPSTFVYAITFDGRVAQESASCHSCVVFYELFSGRPTGRVAVAPEVFFSPMLRSRNTEGIQTEHY